MEERPRSERLCEALCLGFAGWTLCTHAVVAAGGSLRALVTLAALSGAIALAAWTAGRRRARGADALRSQAPGGRAALAPDVDAPSPDAAQRALGRVAIAAALVGAAAAPWLGAIAQWALLCAVLALAAVPFLLLEPARATPPLRSRGAERALVAVAALCALYALCVRRPDADDAFYVSLAVDAIDLPELPLLARDTLHGRFDLPIHYAAYRLHAWELANAAVAWLLGLPALGVFHLGAAPLAAAAVPLAHAVLLRRLVPRAWPWATAALVVVLAVVGETHRWYGNFAFVRIWQGKAVALFVFLPLVAAFALRFALRPSWRRFALLAAAQIAALGCTSTALWLAPVTAWTSAAAVLRPDRRGWLRLGGALASSAYVLAAGLAVRGAMQQSIHEIQDAYAPGVQLAGALHTVLGEGRLHVAGIACLFAAWVCAPPGVGRRFALAVPLAVAVILLDPFTDGFVRANVTGPSFWRALWALPLPVLLALVLVSPLRLRERGGRVARLAPALATALVVAFAALVPASAGWSEANAARLGPPGLKTGPAFVWARALADIAPRRRVVAPPDVSQWIPTLHDHPYPMAVRSYLRPLRERMGEIAYRDRHVMTAFAAGDAEHPRAAAIFERGLDLYDVRAVALRPGPSTSGARAILRRAGFEKRIQATDMEIWARP